MNATRTFPRRAPRQRTEGQLNFLVDLVKQIGAYDPERGRELWYELREQDANDQLVFEHASDLITALKDERNNLRTEAQIESRRQHALPPIPEIPQGRYAVDTNEGHLGFYFVRVSDSGFRTVKVYASDTLHELPKLAQIAILRKIEAAGIEAARNRYADETEHCWKCGKKLTDETSRARRMGPDCAAKL